jgi:hypothetical protein
LAAVEAPMRLYQPMRLFMSCFQPSFRLAEKTREGGLVRKRYHPPRTPRQRATDDPRVPQAVKQALDAEHAALDRVRLLSEIRAAQEALAAIADERPARAASEAGAELDAFPLGAAPGLEGGRGPADRAPQAVQAAPPHGSRPT